jgi:drug/metabolite transporter (DMT)-like permease
MCLSGTPYYFIFNGFALHTNAFTVIMALLYGIAGFSSTLLGIVILKYGKISVNRLIATFLNLSLVALFGFLILHETVSPYKVAGIAVIFVGVAVLFVRRRQNGAIAAQKSGEQKIGKTFIVLSLIQALLGVASVIVAKIYSTKPELALNRNDFLIWDNIFMFTFALSSYLIYCAYTRKEASVPSASAQTLPLVGAERSGEISPPPGQIVPSDAGVHLSVPASKKAKKKTVLLSVLLIAATSALGAVTAVLGFIGYETMPVSLQEPTVTGGGILFGSVAGRIFFKESFTPQIIVGLIIVMAGSVLLGF